jgi:hypothetical protein
LDEAVAYVLNVEANKEFEKLKSDSTTTDDVGGHERPPLPKDSAWSILTNATFESTDM